MSTRKMLKDRRNYFTMSLKKDEHNDFTKKNVEQAVEEINFIFEKLKERDAAQIKTKEVEF